MDFLPNTTFNLTEIITENQFSFYNDGAIRNSSHLTFSSLHNEALLPTWWKLFDKKYLRHSFEWTLVLIIAYMLILVTGIIGNVMVILVIYLRPQMRSVTNIFILNLAVADLFVIVFCVPATLFSNVFAPWMLGSFMCKGVAYVQGVSVYASAYSLAALSLDRCKAIYKSYGRSNGLSYYQASITIFIIWITALILLVPWAVIFEVTETQNGISYCVETWSNELLGKIYFLITNFLLGFCFPLLLISISNFIIWCHVHNRKVPCNSDSSGSIRRMHRQARHGVVKMLGVVTLVFLISWLPLYVLVMRIKFAENISDAEYNLHGRLMPFAQWLGSWGSSVNPILYAFLNQKFRKMFRSLLPSWLPFVGKSSQNFITRGVVVNGTFKSSFRKSSRKSSNNSRKSLLGRQLSRSFSTPVIAANIGMNTNQDGNKCITNLNMSGVKIVESKSLEIGISNITKNVVLIANMGKVSHV